MSDQRIDNLLAASWQSYPPPPLYSCWADNQMGKAQLANPPLSQPLFCLAWHARNHEGSTMWPDFVWVALPCPALLGGAGQDRAWRALLGSCWVAARTYCTLCSAQFVTLSVSLSFYLLGSLSHCLSVCLSLCLSVCLSGSAHVCLSLRLSLCMSVSPSVCPSLSLCVSFCPSVFCHSISLSVCSSISLSVHLYLSLCVSPSVCLSVCMAHESDTRATSPSKQNNEKWKRNVWKKQTKKYAKCRSKELQARGEQIQERRWRKRNKKEDEWKQPPTTATTERWRALMRCADNVHGNVDGSLTSWARAAHGWERVSREGEKGARGNWERKQWAKFAGCSLQHVSTGSKQRRWLWLWPGSRPALRDCCTVTVIRTEYCENEEDASSRPMNRSLNKEETATISAHKKRNCDWRSD